MNKINCTFTSVGLVNILLIIFIVLKLVGVIDWPWIFVLAPLWIGMLFWLVMAAIILLLFIWMNR